ncbi:MAG: hypothetical protein IJE08_15435 [Clostridia bacterium]|nr:hypothetical protein [Clostridia bacterium]
MDRKYPVPISDYYNLERPVSNTDMTGLIPAAVEDEEEADAYEELYPVHRQKPIRSDVQ